MKDLSMTKKVAVVLFTAIILYTLYKFVFLIGSGMIVSIPEIVIYFVAIVIAAILWFKK